jgi:hypothetical protein
MPWHHSFGFVDLLLVLWFNHVLVSGVTNAVQSMEEGDRSFWLDA